MKRIPSIRTFRSRIYSYYHDHKRDLPWRNTNDPYYILVSEIMLQQTQVDRVKEKYLQFTGTFPTVASLASATRKDVLRVWKGLGYNRRALYLKRTAGIIVDKFAGKVPETAEELEGLPGIGPATAASIAAFAFNKAVVFIETNIRAVFIHFFFGDADNIHDDEIRPLVEKSIDRSNPREWYSALMDYGTMLKKSFANPNLKSVHHVRQAPYKGSNRELRGKVLELLLDQELSKCDLRDALQVDSERLRMILAQLQNEGFVVELEGLIALT